MKNTIQFDESAKKFILESLGYTINEKGFIVDNEGKSVKSNKGFFVHEKDFAGVKKDKKTGKDIFYTTDLSSLIDITEENND